MVSVQVLNMKYSTKKLGSVYKVRQSTPGRSYQEQNLSGGNGVSVKKIIDSLTAQQIIDIDLDDLRYMDLEARGERWRK